MITELDMVNINEGTRLWYVNPTHHVCKVIYTGERSKKGKGNSLKCGKSNKPYSMKKLFILKKDADEYAEYKLKIIENRALKKHLESDRLVEDNMKYLMEADNELINWKDNH